MYYLWLLVTHDFQSRLADWTRLNTCHSRSQVLLNPIARRMTVSIICEKCCFLFTLGLLTSIHLHYLGDSAPNSSQLSPGKLYRAALLKNRFADTIFKAREKTLNQVGYESSCFVVFNNAAE